jgi:hypothetical protein
LGEKIVYVPAVKDVTIEQTEGKATALGKLRARHTGWTRLSSPPRRVNTVVIGPPGGGALADIEWVDLSSVMDLARILA